MTSAATLADLCCATDVARGLARYFHRQGQTVLCEVSLPNGRRADVIAIDARGTITLVEIKVSRADLLADQKWPDYLDWCDRFCWALSPSMDPALLDDATRLPERCGLLVGDRYDAVMIREPQMVPLAPARRRSEVLRLARIAMRRMMLAVDPDLIVHAAERDIGL